MVGGLECVLTVTDDHCSPSQESLVFVVVGSPHLISFAPPGHAGSIPLQRLNFYLSLFDSGKYTCYIFSYFGARNETHTTIVLTHTISDFKFVVKLLT